MCALEYRRVECPWCDHVYMWMKDPYNDITFEDGKGKTVGMLSKCPKCAETFAVLEGEFTGRIPAELPEGVTKIQMRGI